jgi:hypothetical protein
VKSKKKYLILGIIWVIFTISGGLAGGFIASVLFGSTATAFWTGLGLGSFFGFAGFFIITFYIYDLFDKEFPFRIRSEKDKKIKKVEEKDDYKN